MEAKKCDKRLKLEHLSESIPKISMQTVQTILKILKIANIVTQDENENWLLMRNLSQYRLSDLYRQHDFTVRMNEADSPNDELPNAAMIEVLVKSVRTWMRQWTFQLASCL